MRTVPRELLWRLRNDVAVTDVIDALGVPTTMRGTRRTFRCPQCEHFRTSVNDRANLARCFRCERNFNPIDRVMSERRWSFLDAVTYLGDLVGQGVENGPHGGGGVARNRRY